MNSLRRLLWLYQLSWRNTWCTRESRDVLRSHVATECEDFRYYNLYQKLVFQCSFAFFFAHWYLAPRLSISLHLREITDISVLISQMCTVILYEREHSSAWSDIRGGWAYSARRRHNYELRLLLPPSAGTQNDQVRQCDRFCPPCSYSGLRYTWNN